MLDTTFLSEERRKIEFIQQYLPIIVNKCKALWLVHAYKHMIDEAISLCSYLPEVIRMPEQLLTLKIHLQQYYIQHIDVNTESIVSDWLLKRSRYNVKEWQDRPSYSFIRNSRNRAKRLATWKRIYDNKYELPKTGEILTYEDVIRERNEGFSEEEMVLAPPFLVLFNDGNVGDYPGYPMYEGVRFIERATQFKDTIADQYEQGVDEFVDYVMGLDVGSLPSPHNWLPTVPVLSNDDHFDTKMAATSIALKARQT